MTLKAEIETLPAGDRVLRRGKGLLKVLVTLLAIFAFAAWIALGVVLYADAGRDLRLAAALAAAVSTEALFWSVAALLGVSVLEARKAIWRRITGFLAR
ncbi:hypothetical protein DDF62_00305 [Caulobacter radicis]|uniref:hypothetical protein n=1 Tax=Caulobacter radicis TaxID=2172650 RepID=UPI000D57BAA4|nr:hypothetical protein [Caulobacter radicis]PVM93543.1 hypothetical protein DDF62_00305 [Caulobacter radicis]